MPAIKLITNEKSPYLNTQNLPVNFDEVFDFHQSMETYEMTPIQSLDQLAAQLGIQKIYVKDESYRFGLNAFKGLGASYAVHEIVKKHPNQMLTFVSCTDGNHGRALAWRAKMLGHNAIIFMPKGSEERRVKAIESFDAKVIVTEMNYDDTVRFADQYAKERGFFLVQDTALPGYAETPNHVVMGYTTMAREALEQMAETPTHVFVQAGVGSMAGGVLWYLHHFYGEEQLPFVGVIEAESVACIYESARQNKVVNIGGEPYTLMAGLNCGEANPNTYPLLRAQASAFITCTDAITEKGMERAQNPVEGDPKFISGESGAVGIGFVEAILTLPEYAAYKEALKLNADSVVLLFSTEGILK